MSTIPYEEEIENAAIKIIDLEFLLFELDHAQEMAINSIVKLCLTGK